jgi:hypothetical protein
MSEFATEHWRVELVWDDTDARPHALQEHFDTDRAERDARARINELLRGSWTGRARRWILRLDKTTGWSQRSGRIVPNRTWTTVQEWGDWSVPTAPPAPAAEQLDLTNTV